MFELDGFELEFDHKSLEAIADLAIERNTGARGLRAIMEEILAPVMFEIPGSAITGVVQVTEEVVRGGATPAVIPFNKMQEKSA
jgi:ATP-dependent Clp protease ATP-binding subunit ClpX